MNIHVSLSQWGLISDMIGVLLLYKFGLPSKAVTVRQTLLAVEDFSKDENKKADKINRRILIGANVGLGFIFVGFVLQFIGGFK